MLTLIISKVSRGCEIQVSSDDYPTAKRVHANFLRASLRADKCAKTTWQGTTANGNYAYRIHVPALPYEVACERVSRLWPDGQRTSYPHPLIGG